jgi:hypothetical protein
MLCYAPPRAIGRATAGWDKARDDCMTRKGVRASSISLFLWARFCLKAACLFELVTTPRAWFFSWQKTTARHGPGSGQTSDDAVRSSIRPGASRLGLGWLRRDILAATARQLRRVQRRPLRKISCHTAMKTLRIVALRFGTARQRMALERWTNPKPQRRTRSSRYEVPSCRGKSAGVA